MGQPATATHPSRPLPALARPTVAPHVRARRSLLLPPFVHWLLFVGGTLWLMTLVQRLVRRWTSGRKLGNAGGMIVDASPRPQKMPATATTCAVPLEPSPAVKSAARVSARASEQECAVEVAAGPSAIPSRPKEEGGAVLTALDRLVSRTTSAAALIGRTPPDSALGANERGKRAECSPRTARLRFFASAGPSSAAASSSQSHGSAQADGGARAPHWSEAFASGGLAQLLERWASAAEVLESGERTGSLCVLCLEGSELRSLQFCTQLLPHLGRALLELRAAHARADGTPAVFAARFEACDGGGDDASQPASAAHTEAVQPSRDGGFLQFHFAVGAPPALLLLWGYAPSERLVLRGRELHRSKALSTLASAVERSRALAGSGRVSGPAALLHALTQFSAHPPPRPAETLAARDARHRAERLELIAQQDAELAASLAADEEAAAAEEAEAEGRRGNAPANAEVAEVAGSAPAECEPAWLLARQANAALLQLDPEPARADGVISVVVRLCTGQRIARRWHAHSPLVQLHGWVEASCAHAEDAPERFVLVTSFPRRVLGRDASEMPQTDALADNAAGRALTIGSALPEALGTLTALLHVEEDDMMRDD